MSDEVQMSDWKVGLRLKWAQAVLLFENIWSASTYLFVFFCLYVAVSFAGLWQAIPNIAHFILFIVLAIVFYALVWKMVRNVHFPRHESVLAALERRSHIQHHPLRDLEQPTAVSFIETDKALSMWRLHMAQQSKQLRQLKFIFPRVWLSEGDPNALRAMALFLVVTSAVFAGGDYKGRLVSSFDIAVPIEKQVLQLDIWATPPEYTAEAPRLLFTGEVSEAGAVSDFKLPQGSSLVATLSGTDDIPVLKSEKEEKTLSRIAKENFQISWDNIPAGRWQLDVDGDVVADFVISLTPDLPPVANLLATPMATSRNALQMLGRAEDDYGVMGLKARFYRDSGGRELLLDLPFPEGQKQSESQSYIDLTADMWAGLPVRMHLEATDEQDQVGRSRTIELILPERRFSHPVARVLVSERKKLVLDPVNNRLPVIATLEAITSLPEAMDHDWGVVLAISVARASLITDIMSEKIEPVAGLLWQAALKLENGNLNLAEQRLRDAEKALMEALNSGASSDEISHRVQELKEAMNAFLAEMATRSLSPEDFQNLPMSQTPNAFAQDDLNRMLSQVDDLAKTGATDEARNLLNQLQNILENLQAAGEMSQNGQMQAGQKVLKELGDIVTEQQSLLDQTFLLSETEAREADEAARNPDSLPYAGRPEDYAKLKKLQEALRQQLGDVMGDLGLNGPIPAPLGRAERAMKRAQEALTRQQSGEAQNWQQKALQQLQQSASSIAQQMMQGQGSGQMRGSVGQDGMPDPLNRLDGPPNEGEGVDKRIPGSSGVSRARAILNELQRRLNEPGRSPLEKDYLKRLLERFN